MDLRFSADKRPYQEHASMSVARGDGGQTRGDADKHGAEPGKQRHVVVGARVDRRQPGAQTQLDQSAVESIVDDKLKKHQCRGQSNTQSYLLYL